MSCQTLTPDEITAIKAKIVRLEASYDDLLAGKAIKRFVDQNGEQVEYTAANADKLLAYIRQLKALVSPQFARCFKPRPVGFVFPRT